LKYGESLEECARRELLEETGLVLGDVEFGPYTNDIFMQEARHYITLYAIGESLAGDAQLREPEKCEAWAWFEWSSLPSPLFLPIENLLKQGYNPFGNEA
jgi:8-oxo-dGTP diphosphatase